MTVGSYVRRSTSVDVRAENTWFCVTVGTLVTLGSSRLEQGDCGRGPPVSVVRKGRTRPLSVTVQITDIKERM